MHDGRREDRKMFSYCQSLMYSLYEPNACMQWIVPCMPAWKFLMLVNIWSQSLHHTSAICMQAYSRNLFGWALSSTYQRRTAASACMRYSARNVVIAPISLPFLVSLFSLSPFSPYLVVVLYFCGLRWHVHLTANCDTISLVLIIMSLCMDKEWIIRNTNVSMFCGHL